MSRPLPQLCSREKTQLKSCHSTIGKPHILSVWPSLSRSPIVQRFAWSPLVLNAVARNVPALLPKSVHDAWNPVSPPMPSISSSENSMLKGLVALHLRRGDYGYHCENMANYSVTFTSWNQFPHLPDRFTPPAGGGYGKTTPENLAVYLRHCWPDADQIMQKLNEVRYAGYGGGNLESIFILTNGDRVWLDNLKLLLSQDGWANVVTSKDLRLTAGEAEVDGAVDMQIAARAEVFIGNGVRDSLTQKRSMTFMHALTGILRFLVQLIDIQHQYDSASAPYARGYHPLLVVLLPQKWCCLLYESLLMHVPLIPLHLYLLLLSS